MKPIITLIFCIIFAFAYFCSQLARNGAAERHIKVQQAHINYLMNHAPTFRELQEKVGAEPDGIIGPNTIALWDKAICDQYAIESFNQMARDTKGDKK